MKQSIKVKKSQITVVKHTIDWFMNRIDQQIFFRIKQVDGSVIRRYILICTCSQALSCYIDQNITGKRFFQ